MNLSVNDRVQWIATFRYVNIRLMEIAAAWTPTTPEMEVKLLLGRHIWDFAQHADALGKRTFEMRRPEQFSQRPVEEYVALLQEIAGLRGTAERLAALYEGVLPGLVRRYHGYLERTDRLLDGPSVVILERILSDLARQGTEVLALRRELRLPTAPAEGLRQKDEALATIVAAQEVPA
jgi:hypothetical protein